MLISIIFQIVVTIVILFLFGKNTQRRARLLYKAEILRMLSLRMREHDAEYPKFYPHIVPSQFLKHKREIVKARKEELSEVAKWLELV
jgi:hypothetical protein